MPKIPKHRTARKFNCRILGCPECRRRFTTYKNLNLHLAERHDAPYLCVPPKNLTTPTRIKARVRRAP